jgi:hypothetical protein
MEGIMGKCGNMCLLQKHMWKETTMYFSVELQDGWGRSCFNCHGLGLKQMLGLKDVHYYPTIVLTM